MGGAAEYTLRLSRDGDRLTGTFEGVFTEHRSPAQQGGRMPVWGRAAGFIHKTTACAEV
jgi:hypothetical protein